MQYSDRLLVADDAPFVVALHAAPHARGHVLAPAEAIVRATVGEPDRERRIVLDADGTPVGFWSLSVLAGGWLVELSRIIALAPRRGIGAFALRRMIDRAFDDLAAHKIYLEVTADNAPARALYERTGFVLEGTFRDGYRDDLTGAYKDLCHYGMLAHERPERLADDA
ncbi:MAG TPA: GNAT family protein [Candidatus Elarobacter sp.]|jgi:ribosomal-protein-alanine N-acetyltransferase